MLFAFFLKFADVAMWMEETFYNITMSLYNKNILEYAEIARNGPKSTVHDIEGLSIIFLYTYNGWNNCKQNLIKYWMLVRSIWAIF